VLTKEQRAMTPTTTEYFLRLVKVLAYSWLAIDRAERPIDARLAKAEFDGAAKAAAALGWGMSDFDILLRVKEGCEAHVKAVGPIPPITGGRFEWRKGLEEAVFHALLADNGGRLD
jgi:hypothetical protein